MFSFGHCIALHCIVKKLSKNFLKRDRQQTMHSGPAAAPAVLESRWNQLHWNEMGPIEMESGRWFHFNRSHSHWLTGKDDEDEITYSKPIIRCTPRPRRERDNIERAVQSDQFFFDYNILHHKANCSKVFVFISAIIQCSSSVFVCLNRSNAPSWCRL